jgi:hypothetical protein
MNQLQVEMSAVGRSSAATLLAMALTNLAPPFRHAPEQDDGLAPSVLPNPELNASSGIIASVLDLAKYSIALGNTGGVHWGNPLNRAKVEKSLLAA